MRADARKNRQRLIDVTVELVLEVGGEPARDAIAERAGVGIGTLYRHFPDQQSLLHAATRHVLEKSISAGEALIETVPNGVDALRQYMHMALDNGIGAVNILHPLLEKPDWPDLRARAAMLMTSLVGRAVRQGSLRNDLSERDIVFGLTRFARPLAVGLPSDEERSLGHRHLDFYLDGLCAEKPAPPEPAIPGMR
jgi:AcrR family transcriptional regulator